MPEASAPETSASIGVPCLGMPTLPCRWSEDELPHHLDCGVSVRVAWASMGSLSKNAWVPKEWHENVAQNWDALERTARENNTRGGGLPEEYQIKPSEDVDSSTMGRRLKYRGCYHDISGTVDRYNRRVTRLVKQMADRRKKPNVAKVTPEDYEKIKHKLQQFHLEPSHWCGEIEQERYDEFLAFLTVGNLPEGVSVGDKHLPNLSDGQAAAVLWYVNEVLGFDINDIRYGPCARCADWHQSGGNGGDWSCEGCGVHVCEDCGYEIRGNQGLESEPWWPQDVLADNYCVKCCELIESHYTQKIDAQENVSGETECKTST